MITNTQTYRDLAARLIEFLETGTAAEGLAVCGSGTTCSSGSSARRL